MNTLLIIFTILDITYLVREVMTSIIIPRRKLKLRPGVHKRIQSKIDHWVQEGNLIKREGSAIRYIGYFGCKKKKKKILLVTSGAHGLETMPKEIGLDYLHDIEEEVLREQRILLLYIPVINWFGFQNLTRCDEHKNDPMRSGPRLPKGKRNDFERPKFVPVLSGWYPNTFLGVCMKFIGNTWYQCALTIPRYWREFYKEVAPYLDSGTRLVWYDLHSGHPHRRTMRWVNELSRLIYKIPRLKAITEKYHVIFTKIRYRTRRGMQEFLVARYGKKLVKAYTIEFSVHDDIEGKTAGLRYLWHYAWHSVFDALPKDRSRKTKEGVAQLRAMLNLHLKRKTAY